MVPEVNTSLLQLSDLRFLSISIRLAASLKDFIRKFAISFAFVILIPFVALCQELNLSPDNINWSSGTVILTNGERHDGRVKYNDKNGILSFESKNESTTYTPKTVQQFWFSDEQLQQERKFYSLPYTDEETSVERLYFFEVLKEFKTFAVLSKIDPVEVKKFTRSPSENAYTINTKEHRNAPGSIVASQSETIYFFGEDGEVTPYLKFTTKDMGGEMLFQEVYYKTKKSKEVLERNVLEKYTEPHYDELKKYAKERKLNFKIKNDLLQILDHYGRIISN